MHFRYASRLTLILSVLLVACDSGGTKPPSGSDAKVNAPDREQAGAGAPSGPNAPAASDPVSKPMTDGLAGKNAPGPFDPTNAPLLCPGCKPNPGGQTGDMGSTAPPCPMPPRALDDALAKRFRVDELHAAFDAVHFSEPLGWGEVADDGVGIESVSSETTIDGDLMVGTFQYFPCADMVSAPATVDFATRDGMLATTARGSLEVRAYELGWPTGGAPSIQLYASDDLTSARGSLDLMLDPSAVQEADLTIAVAGTPDALHGSVRVRVNEYPNEAERLAAHSLDDVSHTSEVFERAAAEYPIDRCAPVGRPAQAGEPLAVLAGVDPAELATQLRTLLGSARELESSWYHGALRTRVSIDPGDALPEPDCAGSWWVSFNLDGHVSSEDGRIDEALTHARVEVDAYSTAIQRVVIDAEHAQVVLVENDGTSAGPQGWIDDLDDNDSLAWPPCMHSEPCSGSAP